MRKLKFHTNLIYESFSFNASITFDNYFTILGEVEIG